MNPDPTPAEPRRGRRFPALVAVMAALVVGVPASVAIASGDGDGASSSGSSTAVPVQTQEDSPRPERDRDCPKKDGDRGASSSDAALSY